jgi:hypothetical protein
MNRAPNLPCPATGGVRVQRKLGMRLGRPLAMVLDRAGGIGYAFLCRHHLLTPVRHLGVVGEIAFQGGLEIVSRAEVPHPAFDLFRPLAVAMSEQ